MRLREQVAQGNTQEHTCGKRERAAYDERFRCTKLGSPANSCYDGQRTERGKGEVRYSSRRKRITTKLHDAED